MAEPIYRVSDNGLGSLVAVGASGLILLSTDNGTTWAAKYSGTTEHLYGAAYGDALGSTGWIVVGASGTILFSTDGNIWYSKTTPITEDLYDVAFGGIFIAIGANGFMASSEDFGTNWLLNESGTTEDLYSIEIDFSSYIIVGANDTVITGEVLSLNFNIECLERVNIADVDVNQLVAERVLTDAFQAVDPLGGRYAGQRVSFAVSGSVDTGDIFRVTLDGVNYDHTVGTEFISKSSTSIVEGGTPVGTDANIDAVDTTYWQIPETSAATPGFDVRLKFENIEADDMTFDFDGRYEGSAGHTVDIQAWNFDTQSWETIDGGDSFVHSVTDQDLSLTMTPANHISSGGQLDPDGVTSAEGDVWVRFVHPTTGAVGHNLYIDRAQIGQVDTTIDDIANALVQDINTADGKFTAHFTGSGEFVVFSHDPPTDFTYTASMQNDPGGNSSITTGTLEQSSSSQQITATISGTVETGDLFRITIDGVNYDYTTDAGDATNDDIASGWVSDNVSALNTAGFDVSSSGAVITITTHTPESEFTYSASTTNGGATDDQDIALSLIRSALLAGMQYQEFLIERADFINDAEDPQGVYNHEITDVVDTLDTFIGNFVQQVDVTDGITMSDTIALQFANGYGGDLTLHPLTLDGEFLAGNMVYGDLRLPMLRLAGQLVRELGGDLVLPLLRIDGNVGADLNITGNLVLPQLQIDGQLIVEVDGTEYVVWVVNRTNKAHSNYANFRANSLVTFNGVDLVATDDGIYELQAGEDDYEGAIDARIMWVPTDYGMSELKRLDAAYVNLRHANGGLIRAIADETEERIYECDMAEHAAGMHKKRVLFVRGIAGEFWQVGFETTEGRFKLGDMEVTPVASKRRIK